MQSEFPRRYVDALQEVAVRLVDARKPGTDLAVIARALLVGFEEVATFGGLDAVVEKLRQGDEDARVRALADRIATIGLDEGGPRNVKPRQLADCVVASLEVTLVDEPGRAVSLSDDVRSAVVAAIGSVVDAELLPEKLREAVVTEARARTEEKFHPSFTKVVAQLDERGQQLVKTPKVPIDALQAIQHALTAARNAVIERIAGAAIDRARDAIASADAEAGARIDRPISVRSTPREVAILRAQDSRVAKSPMFVSRSLLASLTDLVPIAWRVAEIKARPYAASATFVVGDVIEHVKFGRGKVLSLAANRIEVEFPDGKHTLVHVPPRR